MDKIWQSKHRHTTHLTDHRSRTQRRIHSSHLLNYELFTTTGYKSHTRDGSELTT